MFTFHLSAVAESGERVTTLSGQSPQLENDPLQGLMQTELTGLILRYQHGQETLLDDLQWPPCQ